MKVLVINCGSSSLKYQLISMTNESVIAKGICERIGLKDSVLKHTPIGKDPVVIKEHIETHTKALAMALDALVDEDYGVIADLSEISAVGHRVVHGGEKFVKSIIITDEVIAGIEACIELAPLHNPPNITGIKVCREVLPNVPMVAVFDTAFHQTMPEHAYVYAVDYSLREEYGVRRYGFHGTSHKYVAQRAADILGKKIEELKIITCHLGNGASICAIKGGKSIETSMGFSPLDGLAMGTRCGDIDASVVAFMMKKEHAGIKRVIDMLNKESGLLGLSGVSSDFRDVEKAALEGNMRAQLALDVFCYKVKKYIGAYIGVLNGADAIVFTAGVGENDSWVRQEITNEIDFLGIEIDTAINSRVIGIEADISKLNARIRTLVIPTNEELMIARETKDLI